MYGQNVNSKSIAKAKFGCNLQGIKVESIKIIVTNQLWKVALWCIFFYSKFPIPHNLHIDILKKIYFEVCFFMQGIFSNNSKSQLRCLFPEAELGCIVLLLTYDPVTYICVFTFCGWVDQILKWNSKYPANCIDQSLKGNGKSPIRDSWIMGICYKNSSLSKLPCIYPGHIHHFLLYGFQ